MRYAEMREAMGLPEAKDPAVIATDQIVDACGLVNRGSDEFLRFPWASLAQLTGNIPPATVSFVGAFSGGGKTTFVSSFVTALLELRKKIYVMALETTPDHFRTYLACQKLGIRPGDVLTGQTHDMPNGDAIRQSVEAEIKSQFRELDGVLRVSNEESINRDRLAKAYEEAAEWGAELVLVDHIDNIDPDSPSDLYSESVASVKLIDKLSKRHSLKSLLTSQLNNTIATGNKLSKYQPPQVPHFYMGQHKIHVALMVLGLFRPIRKMRVGETPAEYRAALAAAKAGDAEPQSVLEQGMMGVNMPKSRYYGEREGQRAFLRVSRGRVYDSEPTSIEERYGI